MHKNLIVALGTAELLLMFSDWASANEVRLFMFRDWASANEVRLVMFSDWALANEVRLVMFSYWALANEVRLVMFSDWASANEVRLGPVAASQNMTHSTPTDVIGHGVYYIHRVYVHDNYWFGTKGTLCSLTRRKCPWGLLATPCPKCALCVH